MKDLVIAIDGPAASGKSTAGKLVASALGYVYIDTGALYRAAAWLASRRGITPENPAGLEELVERASITLGLEGGRRTVMVDGRDVSEEIRGEDIGHLASAFSALPGLRQALLEVQRRLGESGGVVMDGRDIGTVVFPGAEVKVFLTASEEVRSRRRWLELKERGLPAGEEEVRLDLSRRDERDRSRAHAPLLQAPDAVPLDSSGLDPGEVAGRILDIVRSKTGGPPLSTGTDNDEKNQETP